MVYRPADELSAPEFLDSIKLLPWTNDHAMIGDPAEGHLTPEQKGVGGVIGERTEFDNDSQVVYANIKCWSAALARELEAGKVQLSLGYRSRYEWSAGTYAGQPYDCIQRTLRGNHLASVDAGRMGDDAIVLDELVFTFDSIEGAPMKIKRNKLIQAMAIILASKTATSALVKTFDEDVPEGEAEAPAEQMTLEAAIEVIKGNAEAMAELMKLAASLGAAAAGTEPVPDPEPATVDPTIVDPVEDEGDEEKDKKEPAATMDAAAVRRDTIAEIGRRDKLVARVSKFVGVFDSAMMGEHDVAVYAAGKFGIKCAKGSELIAVGAYLDGAEKVPAAKLVAVEDSAPAADWLKKQIAG
jgi:hypothetical protein